MTTTFIDNRNAAIQEVDAAGDWTGSASPTLFTSEPTPAEATGCVGMAVSTTTDDAFASITLDDYSAGGTLSIWVQANGAMDTQVGVDGGGIQVVVGDGTNRIGYHTGGSDKAGFRHDVGPVKWECHLLDLANKPANFTAFAGSEALLDETSITQVGAAFTTLSKAVGNATNCFWDIIRFADIGQNVEMQGGATSGAAGNAAEAAAVDRSGGTGEAYGVIRELGSGVYGIQGNVTIGADSGSADQHWIETSVTYSWEDRGLSAANYYRFSIQGSSSATNCEVNFTASTFVVPLAASASFDGNGADLTICNMFGCTFIGFDIGIETSDDTGDVWTNCVYVGNATVVANGCDLSGSTFSEYTGIANTSVLGYNLNVDPNGKLDDLTISKTAATAHHAIEFGTAIADAASFTLTRCAFGTDFSGTAGGAVGDETFHFLDTTGSITLNLVGCTGNFGYRTEGVAVSIVVDPVATKVTVQSEVPAFLENARVFLETGDDGGTGFPYQDAVTTLTQSGGTATLTSTGVHGLDTGDKVVVRGAQPDDYNVVVTITVTSTTEFTFPVDSGVSSPATGTPVYSYVAVQGLTNVNGEITASKTWPAPQSLTGWARLTNATSPFYKQGSITVADAQGGTDILITLLDDE